jgi:hypothetical protein
VTEIIEKARRDAQHRDAEAMLPEGQSLRAHLPPTRAALEKALAANGLPAASFDRFRPWYAAVALSTLPLMKSGYDPTNGVDTKLSALATERGIRTRRWKRPNTSWACSTSCPRPATALPARSGDLPRRSPANWPR